MRYSTIIIAILLHTVGAFAEELSPIKPNIVDMKEILQERYARRGYMLLTDSIQPSSFASNKWAIAGGFVVPEGKKLTIPGNVTLFFEPDAFIAVNGELEAAGTRDAPVVFTKIDSADMVKKPRNDNFLWKGIEVGESGKLDLKYAVIRHAQRGVISKGKCDSLVIDSIRFSGALPLALKTSDYSITINNDSLFTLRCPSPLAPKRKKTPRFVYLMYGLGLSAAVTSGVFYASAYNTDREAARIMEHVAAQAKFDKATGQYKVSLVTGVSAAVLTVPAFIFHLVNAKGKDK
ncbi:MAG: hypothetical protein GF401_14710 [Chitinivibrionales bacterium]|nr:hypothetical protein [Chitinivibrionales bacterium]